ncbi:hypothetical protein LJC32_05015 [Oscillospiraceae bacterium OttesenSCG-928-F05]|nr:hypothetical protein [Oscillospiraceae bacterium OttesenSCG-928-F05]
MRRKIALSGAVLALALVVASPAASAHGHGGRGVYSGNTYALCGVQDCDNTGLHRHDGVCYAGHRADDGHNYHQLCAVEGCTLAAVHEHDGVTCYPNAQGTYGHHGGHGKGHRR